MKYEDEDEDLFDDDEEEEVDSSRPTYEEIGKYRLFYNFVGSFAVLLLIMSGYSFFEKHPLLLTIFAVPLILIITSSLMKLHIIGLIEKQMISEDSKEL